MVSIDGKFLRGSYLEIFLQISAVVRVRLMFHYNPHYSIPMTRVMPIICVIRMPWTVVTCKVYDIVTGRLVCVWSCCICHLLAWHYSTWQMLLIAKSPDSVSVAKLHRRDMAVDYSWNVSIVSHTQGFSRMPSRAVVKAEKAPASWKIFGNRLNILQLISRFEKSYLYPCVFVSDGHHYAIGTFSKHTLHTVTELSTHKQAGIKFRKYRVNFYLS